jgi:hypothetical protein
MFHLQGKVISLVSFTGILFVEKDAKPKLFDFKVTCPKCPVTLFSKV